jgi:hypothetical protein
MKTNEQSDERRMEMPKYKYENVKNVSVKEDFQIHKHDEYYEITETIVLEKGTFGIIESKGCLPIDDFDNHYSIVFNLNGDLIPVTIYEKNMEELLVLNS